MSVYCWGSNKYGELGISLPGKNLTASPQPSPYFEESAVSVAAGEVYSIHVFFFIYIIYFHI